MHTLSSGSKHAHCSGAQAEETQDLYSRHPSSCAPQARAASSAAVGGTMPQRTQHPLIHVLLFWITILTVVQVIFIALFFTNGHMSQNTRAVQADLNKQTQAHNASSFSDHGSLGTMLSFTAKEELEGTAVRTIAWTPTNGQDLVLPQGYVLTLRTDGYYFLNLRVTLSSFNPHTPLTVRLCSGGKTLLEGQINLHTNSTGVLSKAEVLTALTELSVSIDPHAVKINYSAAVTHLDIIYMNNPRN